MKKLKSLLILAFLAIGFSASAQIITVNNSTGVTYNAFFSTTGPLGPCFDPAVIPPGPGTSSAFICAAPSGTNQVILSFPPFGCGGGASTGNMAVICGGNSSYTLCVPPFNTLNASYDCVNQILTIW